MQEATHHGYGDTACAGVSTQSRGAAASARRRVTCEAGGGASRKAAAAWAVDTYCRSGMTVGLGTGPLAALAIEHLGRRLTEGSLQGVVGVPTSTVAATEAAFCGVPLTTLEAARTVDVLIEDADRVDKAEGTLPFLKGLGRQPQPDLVTARAVADAALLCVVLVPAGGVSAAGLGDTVPVALWADDWEEAGEELDDLLLGDAQLWRRPTAGVAASPMGGENPFVSAEGHTLVDVVFEDGEFRLDGDPVSPGELSAALDEVDGVLAHGLFGGASAAIVAADEGGDDDAAPETLFPYRSLSAER